MPTPQQRAQVQEMMRSLEASMRDVSAPVLQNDYQRWRQRAQTILDMPDGQTVTDTRIDDDYERLRRQATALSSRSGPASAGLSLGTHVWGAILEALPYFAAGLAIGGGVGYLAGDWKRGMAAGSTLALVPMFHARATRDLGSGNWPYIYNGLAVLALGGGIYTAVRK